MIEDTERQSIVKEAKRWLGTPYHHRAAKIGAGVDCAYLLLAVYGNVGLIVRKDPAYYPIDWHLHRGEERYKKLILEYANPIQTDNPKPGDVALYRFGRCAAHGAIVIDWPCLIHSFAPIGVIYGDADDPGLYPRLDGIYRLKRWMEYH